MKSSGVASPATQLDGDVSNQIYLQKTERTCFVSNILILIYMLHIMLGIERAALEITINTRHMINTTQGLSV